MSRNWSARVCSMLFGVCVIVVPLLPGCGGEEPVASMKPEDAPAAKGKDSMEYYRNQLAKPKGGAKGAAK